MDYLVVELKLMEKMKKIKKCVTGGRTSIAMKFPFTTAAFNRSNNLFGTCITSE